MRKPVLKWELSGIAFVFLLGALLHFLFDWSGESPFIGWFASVNESVWEHFKQGFWPMCLFALIEYRFIRQFANNFLTAKAAAVYIIPIVTGLVFYAYTAIIGTEILIVDIIIFFMAITIGQLTGYYIMTRAVLPRYFNIISIILIIPQCTWMSKVSSMTLFVDWNAFKDKIIRKNNNINFFI